MSLLPESPFCYLVAGREDCVHYTVAYVLEKTIPNGVRLFQLREKNATTRERVVLARILLPILDKYKVPLIINDDIDAAAELGVGVHLGQNDGNCQVARERLGSDVLIGLSITNEEEADNIPSQVDYVGVGPIFATESKPDAAPPLGLATLSKIRKKVNKPLVAIGGIKTENVADVIATGVDGVAVISLIGKSYLPHTTTAEFCAAFKGAPPTS